jgi:bacterioferritin (cytochrome b1)
MPREEEEERLDVDEALERLQAALRLQYRSALAYAAAAGSVVGFSYAHLGDSLWRFAERDLEDARRLVEKIVTYGALPTTEIAPLRCFDAPAQLVDWLIEAEEEATEALQDCIAPTGREARSEALEHRLEHMIMRKQEQIDLLQRARRAA